MEKISGETPDLTQENIQKIAELFPDVMTESYDDEGNLVRSVDFDALKGDLADHVVEGTRERYQFTWPGKAESKLEARRPTTKTMRPCPEKSVNWDTTQNLYIEGDNLEALKIMRETYAGKVKLIYIDPPYNTGHDFVYDDDFAQTKAEYDETSGDYDEEGGRLVANPESNGRFHSDWCSMMYPRLLLARDMLSEDGVIFISIDDEELVNSRKICDGVFGSSNFIATIVRNTNSSKNQSLFVSVSHEYCLSYAMDLVVLKKKHANKKWCVKKNNIDEYVAVVQKLQKEGLSKEEITEELKTLTSYPRFVDFTNYWYFDKRGLYSKGDLGGVSNGNMKPLLNPLTGRDDPVPPGGFRFGPKVLQALVDEGRIHFHTDGSLPRIKRYLRENYYQRPKSIMSDDQRPDANLLNKEFNTPFDNPKQLSFIKRIFSIVDQNSIILDFFSGSGTSAHAAMELNAADGGTRRFIMVQLDEKCDKDTAAYKEGYSSIIDIGEERIRRAGKKILAEVDESNRQLKLDEEPKSAPDVGFRVMRIDDSCFKDDHVTPQATDQSSLDDLIDNSVEGMTDLDLLFQVLPKFRIPYSASIEKREIAGTSVYDVDDGKLLACFGKDVSTEVIEAIAKEKPVYAVFRDASLADDSAAANLEELFKTFSPDTIRRVI